MKAKVEEKMIFESKERNKGETKYIRKTYLYKMYNIFFKSATKH